MDVRLPDGTIVRNVPEGITKAELIARVGKLPANAAEDAAAKLSKAKQRFAEDDAARKKANEAAPWYEQFGTGIKTQAGRTVLGVAELANNLTGDRLMDPEVLAEAQREADRRDAGTGGWGFAGNVAGDFRNLVPVGGAANAARTARSLSQAVKQSAKIAAAGGALTGLTEGTGDADSTVLTHLGNAAIGGTLGAGVGVTLPVAATAVKGGVNAAKGGLARTMALMGSESAAEKVAYGNIARALTEQGYAPGEVANVIDEFRAQGLDGATLGQMLQSGDLLTREKNLLQGGGLAGRIMGEKLREQPRKVSESVLRKAGEYAQPEQTGYLYKQAAEIADAPTSRVTAGGPSMGQSASARELPFTVNAIRDDIAERLPLETGRIRTALRRIEKTVLGKARSGRFEDVDNAKKMLDGMYVENAADYEQAEINRIVSGYRKMLNDALETAGGDTYKAAKQSAQRDMAMREVADAVKGSQGAGVKTALNRFFGSMEQQEEFLRKLPDDATRAEFLSYLENLQKVAGRFGGSDTASNTATQKAMKAETGFGFDANVVSPQSWVDRFSAPISRNVRRAQAEATFAPDTETLTDAMQKARFGYTAPAAVPRVIANELAKEADGPEQGSPAPEEPVPAEPVLETQPVVLTPAPEAAAPDLVDRIAQAESSGNPDAKNTKPGVTAEGLLGFNDDTWALAVAKWGKELGITLKDKMKPDAQLAMGRKLAEDNGRILAKKLGRPPTDGELYAAHALGASDALKLLQAQGSGREAVLLFPRRVVNSNREWFYRPKSEGGGPRTVEEVLALLTNKV